MKGSSLQLQIRKRNQDDRFPLFKLFKLGGDGGFQVLEVHSIMSVSVSVLGYGGMN